MDPTQQMVIAVITSSAVTGAVTGMIKYFIDRHDRKSSKCIELENNLENVNKILKDNLKAMNKVLDDMKKELEKLAENVKNLKTDNIVMLHDRIYQIFNFFKDLPEISLNDKANIDYVYQRYHANGGNHKAEIMYKEICKKPVKVVKDVNDDGINMDH